MVSEYGEALMAKTANVRSVGTGMLLPPRAAASAGGFTVRRLANPITIDGRTWIAVNSIMETKTVRAPSGQFAIINGTLEAIDAKSWRKYSLSKAFNIEPYVILRAISADGRRLVISQQDCPFDCGNAPDKHYEIGFPAGEAPAADGARTGKLITALWSRPSAWPPSASTPYATTVA